jgi:hypothetical protein
MVMRHVSRESVIKVHRRGGALVAGTSARLVMARLPCGGIAVLRTPIRALPTLSDAIESPSCSQCVQGKTMNPWTWWMRVANDRFMLLRPYAIVLSMAVSGSTKVDRRHGHNKRRCTPFCTRLSPNRQGGLEFLSDQQRQQKAEKALTHRNEERLKKGGNLETVHDVSYDQGMGLFVKSDKVSERDE